MVTQRFLLHEIPTARHRSVQAPRSLRYCDAGVLSLDATQCQLYHNYLWHRTREKTKFGPPLEGAAAVTVACHVLTSPCCGLDMRR